jgi:hypothetical protein
MSSTVIRSWKRLAPRAPTALAALSALFTAVLLAAAALGGCNNDDDDGTPPEDPARGAVAQVAFERVPFMVRARDESEFSRTSGRLYLAPGTTIRSLEGPVILNVVQAVQVQLSVLSELLLVGTEIREGKETLVLGLQAGEVRINSLAYDRPQVLETPVGRVKGTRAHFTAKVTIDEDGAFALDVQALTRGLVLSNELGSIPLPIRGRGHADETDPPRVLPLPVRK